MRVKEKTYQEVMEQTKNKKLEDLTKQEALDRYFAYGTKEDYQNVEIQKLMIKHGLIEELIQSVESIITDNTVIAGILSSSIYVPLKYYGAVRGKIESTENIEGKELPQGMNWLILNFNGKQYWNGDTKSWENVEQGRDYTQYQYAYCEEQQKQYKEEINKSIGQELILITKNIRFQKHRTLCCILKEDNNITLK